MSGIQIGEKHTEKDWGLIWTDFKITAPEAQTMTIQIPGRDGLLDLTEALGDRIRFNNRTLSFTFVLYDKDMKKWHKTYSNISNYCHGKVKDIILDTDEEYYWNGRCVCESTKEDARYSSIIISVDAHPYKRGVTSTVDDWLWDPFSFEDGIAQTLKNINFTDTLSIPVFGFNINTAIKITCNKAMQLEHESKWYHLQAGENALKELKLRAGENTFKFTCTGNGAVTIDFREERL